MICLALDTTGSACSAALVDEARVLSLNTQPLKRGHAEYLAPQIQKIMRTTGVSPKDIGRIAVCTGPGSFTGLRVALALGRGMALPLNVDVVGISALDIWAAMADPEQRQTVWSFADVRRGEMFGRIYKSGIAQGLPQLLPLAPPPQSKNVLSAGSAAPAVGPNDLSANKGRIDVCVLGWLALGVDPKRFLAEPLYHRAPDAKLPGGVDP